MKTLILIFCLIISRSAYPNETCAFLQCAGSSYTNCTVEKSSPADAIILYDGGGAKVRICDLPPNIQKALNYTPDSARQYLEEQTRKKQAAAQHATDYARAAADRWKQSNCRIIAGALVKITDLKTFSGKVTGFKDGRPVIQTFTTNNTYETVYFQGGGNSAIGAYPGPMAGPAQRLVSSDVVAGDKFLIAHYPRSMPLMSETVIIRAVQLPGSAGGTATLDCGEPYILR